MTSAAEAETAGLFYNCQTAIDIRNMLKALGHRQPATPVKTDNSTAESFVKNLIKQRRSKSWDVRYHWLPEKQNDNTFNIYWDRGNNNWSDYHSNHHSPTYHRKMRKYYILKGFLLKTLKMSKNWTCHWLRGCVHTLLHVSYVRMYQPNTNCQK